MLYAVAGHTAAELLVSRSDPRAPNMGLTTWKGAVARKRDAVTARNYLRGQEVAELNLIVNMFLDTAERRAVRREVMTLAMWAEVLDRFLASNGLPVLVGEGRVSATEAVTVAGARWAVFEAERRAAERAEAESVDDLAEWRGIAAALANTPGMKGGGDG